MNVWRDLVILDLTLTLTIAQPIFCPLWLDKTKMAMTKMSILSL